MALLLVRHGDAVRADSHRDTPRYLSARGRAETVDLAKQLRAAGLSFGAMISSPLVRAVQTAELLASEVGYRGVITTDVDLVPDADPGPFCARAPSGPELTVVVCHEPIVRGIAAHLIGASSFRPFVTSGAVLFSDGPGQRTVIAQYQP